MLKQTTAKYLQFPNFSKQFRFSCNEPLIIIFYEGHFLLKLVVTFLHVSESNLRCMEGKINCVLG